jgi:acetyl esterase/lipase
VTTWRRLPFPIVVAELKIVFAVVFAVVSALFIRFWRRLLRGPAVASWSWAVELTVVAMRAGINAVIGRSDLPALRRLGSRLDPPLLRGLRSLVDVEGVSLGGRPAERHTRRGELAARGDLLYLHGGGYAAGSPASHRNLVASLTWETGLRAWALAYRLAPEHPFPSAVDDAEAAYRELLDAGIDPNRLVIAGDSAGGGLAMALLLRLKSVGVPLPAGAFLFSPYVDLEHTGASLVANAETDYLPRVPPGDANDEYLAGADPRLPEASPLHGDLTDLPHLLILAGDREMIFDDGTRLVERARAAGVSADLHVGTDMPHVWPALFPYHPASKLAFARIADWVAATVS